ncbi:hypothetical protein ACFOG5_20470 [Pedobacter fastidiosus]|uniref:Uncharacterized protein n=1 Tax=Pedobacter fastidiosus TaxID=2765361 RepID=A0ABR7KU97_9SPHI|nr:hypothetical protein [Pedobacter fastidiosus]MBC6111632.1 hypothetical protein [Pedobacter fastidiosus]
MKKLLIGLLFVATFAKAQKEIKPFGDALNTPLREKQYVDVSGSPYLFDAWAKGKVTTKSGKLFNVDSLKYDLIDDQLIFKDEKGVLMHFEEPITKFEIENGLGGVSYFVNGLPASDGSNPSSYFEIINKGKVSLYKRSTKTIVEDKPYGSATVNKSFQPNNSYFVLQEETLKKINLNSKNAIALFESKKAEMTDYLKKNKVNFKNDEDLKNLFTYFNKL